MFLFLSRSLSCVLSASLFSCLSVSPRLPLSLSPLSSDDVCVCTTECTSCVCVPMIFYLVENASQIRLVAASALGCAAFPTQVLSTNLPRLQGAQSVLGGEPDHSRTVARLRRRNVRILGKSGQLEESVLMCLVIFAILASHVGHSGSGWPFLINLAVLVR